ncbi:MAG: hypothetical protein GF388_00225 [Candidatus Aegiribacteria sp.]|nr:hypothetical protein [Candidatus Aegiribacteria sp.]MBD3293880.1 hypothetical protein [Candidatus Fermentibacteria bacterium]
MFSRLTVALCFTAAVVLVAGCGSNPSGSGGSGAAQYSLGWGRNLADQVRDTELPDGLLFMISCIDVNDEGEPETGLPWQFYYADPADSSNVLIVLVQYIGTTNHYWEDSTNVPVTELPDYDDAGPWVEVAKDSMGTAYEDWEEYALIVKGNDYPEFPLITNVAVLQFMSPDTTEQATAIVDSDNDSFLGLITYP